MKRVLVQFGNNFHYHFDINFQFQSFGAVRKSSWKFQRGRNWKITHASAHQNFWFNSRDGTKRRKQSAHTSVTTLNRWYQIRPEWTKGLRFIYLGWLCVSLLFAGTVQTAQRNRKFVLPKRNVLRYLPNLSSSVYNGAHNYYGVDIRIMTLTSICFLLIIRYYSSSKHVKDKLDFTYFIYLCVWKSTAEFIKATGRRLQRTFFKITFSIKGTKRAQGDYEALFFHQKRAPWGAP